MRRAVALAFLLVATAAAGCGGSSAEPHAAGGNVVELTRVDQIRSAFASDAGKPRLVLLLSPT